MVEILNPQKIDISGIFEKEFKAMIAQSITLEELEKTRDKLVTTLRKELTPNERQFIVSMKQGQPLWDLLEIEGIEDLPAVKWKLLNILNMDPIKHKKAVHKLRDYLGV